MRLTFFLLFITVIVHAQQYDLIVTSKNDSIACNIKNITEDTIHFEMEANYKWVKQVTPKNQVIEFSYKTINSDDYKFKKGSTIIISKREEINPKFGRLRNSVYASTLLAVNYSRLIPVKNSFALNLGVGLSFFENRPMVEATFLFGGPKYYFEIGGNIFNLSGNEVLLLQAGFRYQSPKGFLLRIAPMYANLGETHNSYIKVIIPYISLGYSF